MRPMNNYANKYAVALAAMKQANAIDVTKWLLCIANTLAVPVVAIAAGAAAESAGAGDGAFVVAAIVLVFGILGVLLTTTVLGWFEHMLRVNAQMLAEAGGPQPPAPPMPQPYPQPPAEPWRNAPSPDASHRS